MSDSEEEITDIDQGEIKMRTASERKKLRKMAKSAIIIPADTISLSGTLKRGLKLGATDVMEGKTLTNTLKRELKSSVSAHAHSNSLNRGESLRNLSTSEEPLSPRSPSKWSFSVRKKKDDDTLSIASSMGVGPKSPKTKSLRNREIRGGEYIYDDTVSMLEGLLVDTQGIRPEEGIRDSIGRKMTVTLKKMIKLERAGGDQVDAKVLTLTPDRVFILGVKSPFKVEINFHFLDIKAMDSPSPDRLNVSTANGKIYFMQMIGTDDADHIIGRVALSLRTIFPGVSLSKIMKASLEPLSRQKVIQSMLNQADMTEPGPCGNFSVMYECMCNYLGLPVREEVGWDVDTIYLSQNCKELNFKDFDLPDQKDFIPIISVLKFNRWFEGLVIRNIKLGSEVLDAIVKVVRGSNVLKQLVLEGVGLKGDVVNRLAQEMIENKECSIDVLDLSSNPLEDKAVMHLSGSLPLLRHGGGLRILKLDRTGLTAKGVSGLCQALRSSPIISRTLTKLTLSDNGIKGEEAIGLYNYLSTKNHLEHLDVSGTECAVEIYISAMSKGCLEHLKTINLSRNHFFMKGVSARPPHYIEEEYTGNRKTKETVLPNTFQEFFKTTKALADIDLSGMRVPPEAVRQVMDGLCQNFTEGLEVKLNLCGTELRSAGAQNIGAVIGNLTNLVGLDISDNGLDSELGPLLCWIQQNRSLRELKLGKNFSSIKPKHMRAVMDSIVQLVQEDRSCLESLSLCDSKLRDWTTVLLGCLGSNTSLTSLDISGNMIGDAGARVLAKALQINSKIRTLMMDRNSLSANGFHEIAAALEKNFTLRYMPYPVNDAVAAMKNHPDKTQASLAKIQDLLLRNANANKNSNEQQFRLQRAVTCTAQEVLDRVAEKVDDAINALELLEADTACSDVVVKAKGLVKDAKSSKQLLSDIYGLGMEKTAGDHSNLRRKLEQMSRDMDAMVQEHIKNTVRSMTKNAESQCPHIFEGISHEIEDKTMEVSHLPENFVKDRLISKTGTEIINKVSELNLSVATLISDKVTDTLLAALSQCNTTLTEQLKRKKQEQAAAREQLYREREEAAKENDTKVEVRVESPEPEKDAEPEPEETKEQKPDKKPTATDNILPAMRQERAASIARRKQRPISNPALDLDYKSKAEDRSSPPRSSSPIAESAPDTTTESGEAELEVEDETKVVDEKDLSVSKKQKIEAEEQDKEEKKEDEEDKKSEEMVNDDSKGDSSDEHDGQKDEISLDLPELPANTQKLQHVTKGRARPNRRQQRKPAVKNMETDNGVDDFFNASVQSTDFDKVPTLTEAKKEAEKEAKENEKTPKRQTGFALPGLGTITPEMLRRKKKPVEDEKEEEKEPDSPKTSDEEKHEEKNGEAEEERPKSPEPAIRKKPPGAMGLPGMGFGSNVFAEMKLKKLQKTKSSDADKVENGKTETESTPVPFGRAMLKKTNQTATSPVADKSEPNNNNSNNNKKEWTHLKSSAPNRFKSRSFEKDQKPDVSIKSPTKSKSPLMPRKPTPPAASSKPGKGATPPPLPSKPKPAALRPDSDLRGSRPRPMSEFVDPKKVPSSVKSRALSWGKKPSIEDK